jgi:hypothetical protein
LTWFRFDVSHSAAVVWQGLNLGGWRIGVAYESAYLLLTANAFEVFAIFRLTRKPCFGSFMVKFG